MQFEGPMKKILVFLLACLAPHIQCMEQPTLTNIKLEPSSFASWLLRASKAIVDLRKSHEETQLHQDEKISEKEDLVNFDNWSDELIVYLFSFIPEASSMKEIFNKLAQLSLVNRKFKQIADDEPLLNQLAKRFTEFHSQEAESEFIDAIDLILKDNRNYIKIAEGLVGGINTNITNQVLLNIARTCPNGNEDLVKLLLEFGADANVTNNFGHTPLILTSTGGHKEIVKLLLDHGANVNATNNKGYTALWWASFFGYKEIVALLLNCGADVNISYDNGETALTLASSKGHKEIVKLLLDSGSDVKAANIIGNTALIKASGKDQKKIVKHLLNAGSDPNIANIKGNTPLMIVSSTGDEKIAQLLLDYGADVNVANNKGITALMRASSDGSKEIVTLLLDKGADVNAVDNAGWGALKLASRSGHKDIVDLLKVCTCK